MDFVSFLLTSHNMCVLCTAAEKQRQHTKKKMQKPLTLIVLVASMFGERRPANEISKLNQTNYL